jgi:hypothetical protein
MLSVRKWPARLALAAMVAAAPASARATDIYDAWINVFANKAFTITEVENKTIYGNGAQYDTQTIKGTHNGGNMLFSLQKIYGTSSHLGGFDAALIDSPASSAKGLAQKLGLPETEVTGLAKVSGKFGRGATVEIKACRAAWYGLSGDAQSGGFQYLVTALSCGDKDDFSRYLREEMRPSTRAANRGR